MREHVQVMTACYANVESGRGRVRNGEAADVYEHYLQSDLSHMDRMSMELRIKQLRSTSP